MRRRRTTSIVLSILIPVCTVWIAPTIDAWVLLLDSKSPVHRHRFGAGVDVGVVAPTALYTTTTAATAVENNQAKATPESRRTLENVVCLVTGASRGIGKGIALELGAQGATVYLTGTSTSASTNAPATTGSGSSSNGFGDTSPADVMPGTIEETAELVTQLGGTGIAVRCDHSNDTDVQNVMDRIAREQNGRGLDILVNNAFRLPNSGVAVLNQKFWKQSTEAWDSIHTVGLRSHYVTTCYAMPLLFQARDRYRRDKTSMGLGQGLRMARPLIVMIGSFGGLTYTFNVAYGVGKAGVDRMAKDMAVELASEDICVVSLWPGVVDTERTKVSVANGDWQKYVNVPLDQAESPQFTGRAVVALALDADNRRTKSGTYQVVAELATEYGFTDIDGTTPPSIRSLRFLLPSYAMDEATRARIPASWIPDVKLPFWIMAQGRPPDNN